MQVSLTLNISADLQSLFTWNTKQVNHLTISCVSILQLFLLMLYRLLLIVFVYKRGLSEINVWETLWIYHAHSSYMEYKYVLFFFGLSVCLFVFIFLFYKYIWSINMRFWLRCLVSKTPGV